MIRLLRFEVRDCIIYTATRQATQVVGNRQPRGCRPYAEPPAASTVRRSLLSSRCRLEPAGGEMERLLETDGEGL
jgi:hypothetical protein